MHFLKIDKIVLLIYCAELLEEKQQSQIFPKKEVAELNQRLLLLTITNYYKKPNFNITNIGLLSGDNY